jgi:hypothetical protein
MIVAFTIDLSESFVKVKRTLILSYCKPTMCSGESFCAGA